MPIQAYSESGLFSLTVNGKHFQLPRFCPHRGGRLDHGNVNSSAMTVTCPLHHSTFCLKTGAQLSGPPCGPLSLPEGEKMQEALASMREPSGGI